MIQKLLALTANLLLVVAHSAHAQQPMAPPLIRIVVPVSAGASNDILARVIGAVLTPNFPETRAGTTAAASK
jgi:tripartite-type tricarboxylate transporter receptor subunit TctC